MRHLIRHILAVALLAAGVMAITTPTSAQSPVDHIEVEATSTTSVVVRWTAATDAHRWLVSGFGDDVLPIGGRYVDGHDREVEFVHLAPGTRYTFWIGAMDADGVQQSWGGPASGTTPAEDACAVASTTCVYVDATATGGQVTGRGAGLLHGVNTATSADRYSELAPDYWRLRLGDTVGYAAARAQGAAIVSVLNQPWYSSLGGEGVAIAPWTVPDLYQWWVRTLVEATVASGGGPDYWEIDNEPNVGRYDTPMTKADLAEYHRLAVEAIRDVDPHAKIVGPSAAAAVFGAEVPDLEAFIEAQNELGFEVDALSWHENGSGCYLICSGGPRGVIQHAADARRILEREGHGDTELHVNEWGAPWFARNPGAIAGYLSAMVAADIDRGARSCWEHTAPGGSSYHSCDGQLDGLVLADGTTPTDAWHVHKAFADMAGPGMQEVRGVVDDPGASVLATSDGSTIRVLYGHHAHCQPGVDDYCPGRAAAPPKVPTTVLVDVPSELGTEWTVTAALIPNVRYELDAPATLGTWDLSAVDGRLAVPALAVADGEAVVLTVTPR